MGKTWKLKRTVQCEKCPWKKDTNPFDIPDGYSEQLHYDLGNTISSGGMDHWAHYAKTSQLNIMGCHHHTPEEEVHCIGWLHNQIGPGNNIPLRINMMFCENAADMKVIGEQHDTFGETLPENKGFTGPTEQEPSQPE